MEMREQNLEVKTSQKLVIAGCGTEHTETAQAAFKFSCHTYQLCDFREILRPSKSIHLTKGAKDATCGIHWLFQQVGSTHTAALCPLIFIFSAAENTG